jgi:hypothetical protein
VNDYADSMTHVWDQDGLWVGRLFDQPDLKAAPAEAYQTCGENFGGSLWVNPKTGAVLYYAGGQNNTPVFRITGWDQFQRQAGRVVLAPDIATRLQARAEEQAGPPGVIHIPFLREVRTEGDLKKWQDVKPIVIRDGDHELAKLYLAWNANGLYAAFDVTTDRPWKSGSTASLAFEGGAAVDVSVGPVDPDRKKPAAGDTRIVAAPLRQGSRIVEFQPVLAPDLKPADRAPATYETGQGKVTFDRVAPLPGDWIGCQEKPGGQGYVVEMRIPLHGPLEPAPGQKLRLDASVILSNLQGTHITARVPWHSQDPDDAITNDTYLESLLRPANWGYAVLE